MKYTAVMLALLLTLNLSWASEVNFYANKTLQSKHPPAFATDLSSLAFHKALDTNGQQERDLIVKAISQEPELMENIIHFNELEIEKKVEVLQRIFFIECSILKIPPPELIIDENSIPGYAYFDFDYQTGGAGKVFLNKKKLKESKDSSEFIILLLHETRHSAQFQISQRSSRNALSEGFEASFKVQKELKAQGVKLSFCDFMLLLNEFEAFQFANYIYGSLTQFQTPINDMGTLASQFDHKGLVRLNLLDILTQTQSDPIELFNQLSTTQYEVIYE